MIYLDSSVALARLLFEPRAPPLGFWEQRLVSSRLLEYEVWNRVHAYGLTGSDRQAAERLLMGVELFDLVRVVLSRALLPWSVPLRTLDALHLATAEYLHRQDEPVELASYDGRMTEAAQSLGIPIAEL